MLVSTTVSLDLLTHSLTHIYHPLMYIYIYIYSFGSSHNVKKPFEACFGFVADINSKIERYTTWPRDVGQAISNGQSSCPAP